MKEKGKKEERYKTQKRKIGESYNKERMESKYSEDIERS